MLNCKGKSKKGFALAYTVVIMVVLMSLCALITAITLSSRMLNNMAETVTKQKIFFSGIGNTFYEICDDKDNAEETSKLFIEKIKDYNKAEEVTETAGTASGTFVYEKANYTFTITHQSVDGDKAVTLNIKNKEGATVEEIIIKVSTDPATSSTTKKIIKWGLYL